MLLKVHCNTKAYNVLHLTKDVPCVSMFRSKSSFWPLKRGAKSLDVAENKTGHPTKLSATWSAVAALNQVYFVLQCW